MSDYSMPVLSKQDKQSLISFCESEMPNWSPDGDYYPVFAIALAALTAKPVAWAVNDTRCHTHEGAGYSHSMKYHPHPSLSRKESSDDFSSEKI